MTSQQHNHTSSTTNANTHSAFKALPVFDMANLYSAHSEKRIEAAKSLDKAVRSAGFFYLKNHGVPSSLIEQLKTVSRRYFAQDHASKMRHYIGLSANHTGYVPQGEEQFYSEQDSSKKPDLKEAFDIGPEGPSLMARHTEHATMQWPEDPAFKQTVKAYYDVMLELSRVLFRGFALALNLPEDTFTQYLTYPPSQLRLIHYFENPEARPDDSGIGAHTDYEFFTILLPTAPGLQVLNGAKEWINVPVRDDAFVINIGDMMELVSNGEYLATSHRVRQVTEERYAFPFFSSLDYHTLVAPLEHFKDHKKQCHYSSLICGDHLLAQTAQTFRYLKKRIADGELSLPEEPSEAGIFGQHTR